jgi:hypothetical protein
MVEGIAATVTLLLGAGATRATARALDIRGQPVRPVPAAPTDGIFCFSVSAENATLWYQVDME